MGSKRAFGSISSLSGSPLQEVSGMSDGGDTRECGCDGEDSDCGLVFFSALT